MPSETLTTPSVTTRWPGPQPLDDLDPAARRDAGADRGAAGAALRRRRVKTKRLSPSPTTASSGTESAMRGGVLDRRR